MAGLGLLNVPYYWIGAARTNKGLVVRFYDLVKNETKELPLTHPKIYLRAYGDFDKDLGTLSFSADGKDFTELGKDLRLAYQMKTFQGVRYALFAFNTEGKMGGQAAFDNFKIEEPLADRSKNLPLGKVITLVNLANDAMLWASPRGIVRSAVTTGKDFDIKNCQFRVLDKGNGKVALEAMDGSGYLTVAGDGLSGDLRVTKEESKGSLFVWQDMLRHQCMLLSLQTNRYVGVDVLTGEPYSADWPGAMPDRKNGTVFQWTIH